MKGQKFFYRLLAKGKQHKAFIGGQLRDVNWDCIYPSEVKYVFANNEEEARKQIREKINSSGKWHGFVILEKEKKDERNRISTGAKWQSLGK